MKQCGYEKKPIFNNGKRQADLVEWEPNSESLPHDHGSARGKVIILEGEFWQERFHKLTKRYRGTDKLKPGDIISEGPGEIHIFGTKTGGKTLNYYDQPLQMTFYEKSELVYS